MIKALLMLLPAVPLLAILTMCGNCWLSPATDSGARKLAQEDISWWGRIFFFYGIIALLFYFKLL